MSDGRGFVQTVTGPMPAASLGLVLPHEHLFNHLSGKHNEPSYDFTAYLAHEPVSAAVAWALRYDPYCSPDNVGVKSIEDVLCEVSRFRASGGGTIVDVTSSFAIGRDPLLLRRVAEQAGISIVMGCGAYLEKCEGKRIHASVEAQAKEIDSELANGDPEYQIRPGIIGEIGVSPNFTDAEHSSLRASALAQLNHPDVALMIHLPGWKRRGHEVLDIVIEEIGVAPDRIVLAHMDPSGHDFPYQASLANRGVWLEFDNIGMDISFPGEGAVPSLEATLAAVGRLIDVGYSKQLLLSHDLFLKQMWTKNGGQWPSVRSYRLFFRAHFSGIPRGVGHES